MDDRGESQRLHHFLDLDSGRVYGQGDGADSVESHGQAPYLVAVHDESATVRRVHIANIRTGNGDHLERPVKAGIGSRRVRNDPDRHMGQFGRLQKSRHLLTHDVHATRRDRPMPSQQAETRAYLVRTLVDQAAIKWCITDEIRYGAKLILTEFATNAAKLYEGHEITAWLALCPHVPGAVELAVWDPDGSTLPSITRAADDAIGGRGLAIVYELCEGRLGWYPSPTTGGKVVWARFGR